MLYGIKVSCLDYIYSMQKNDTANLPLYTMFTGEGNPYNLSKISLVNGKRLLNFWGGEEKDNQCNIVKGSDGSTFNPYIKKVSID